MDRTFTNASASDRNTTMTAATLRRLTPLAALAAALSGCGQPATKAPEAAKPGVARSAATAEAVCTGNGAHGAHVQGLGLDCAVCHPGGPRYGFTNAYTYPRGTTSAGGTVTPSTPTAPATCSVGCHSPLGAPPHVVAWTAPGPLACTACHDAAALPQAHPAVSASATRADCEGCHLGSSHTRGTVALAGHAVSWMDRASAGFHAFAADRGLSRCQSCHRQDLTGGVTGSACASCHRAGGLAASADFSTCTGCHGGTDDATGAPPRAIWGRGSDAVRVGAHAPHVAGSGISPAIGCAACHVVPSTMFSAGHIDELTDAAATPTATVEFGGLATLGGATPGWDRSTARCASTYCHGNFPGGNAAYAPTWTAPAATACGTCHGLPPGGGHPGVDPNAGLAACSGCHPETIAPTGQVIAPASGGKHLDGVVEAAGHPASWMDPASGGFHAESANLGLASCQGCHGQDLAGGSSGISCASCHDRNLPVGVASWKVNCVMCHGGGDNQTGAPPKATWGRSADATRIGAHTRHVTDGLARASGCGVCHVVPADALSAGHIDAPTATVTVSGVAVSGGVTAGWDRASGTCASTYCHGNFRGGNAANTPIWTAAVPNACGTCHGLPPGGNHPQNADCARCHDGYTATTVNAALHVNGAVDVMNLTCSSCHGEPVRPATALNPQLAAAPPIDTYGNTATSARGVGAHQAHLQASASGDAVACTECHAVPTLTTHADGAAQVAFGPLARTGGAAPLYAGGTCTSTYCHGATLAPGGKNRAPRWTGGSGEAACGTCHALPPPNPPHPVVTGGLTACAPCHGATIDAAGALIPASAGGRHLDGTVQATGGHGPSWMDTGSAEFHAYAANRGLEACQGCHGTNLDGVGGSTTVACAQCHTAGGAGRDFAACTGCHGGTDNPSGAPPAATWGNAGDPGRGGGALDPIRVGAHTAHVSSGPLTVGFDCGVCHPKPASMLDAGHVDGSTATVTFGGVASAGTTPSWARSTATCASTYCHGATLAGGTATTPTWTTVDGSQASCGSCHGYPPMTGRHSQHSISWGLACEVCHPTAPGYVIDPALHVNGARNLNQSPNATRFGGFGDWNPAAVGPGTLRGTSTGCHASTYYWTGAPPPGRYGCQ